MYKLTLTTRFLLKQPIGTPLKNKELQKLDPNKVITIGDTSSLKAIDIFGKPRLAIFDARAKRKPLPLSVCNKLIKHLGPCEEVNNPAGTISNDSIHMIQKAAKGLSESNIGPNEIRCIRIIGEEDLLLLPVIKYFPLGYTIIYGFPGIGLLKIIISKELKDKIDWVLSEMKVE